MAVLKHPTAYWTAQNPILPPYDLGIEEDTGLVKVGDGLLAWNDLDYVPSGGASAFIDLSDVPGSYAGQSLNVVRVNATEDGLEFVALAGGGDMLSTNNLSDVANVATSRTNLGIDTTANQTDSLNKRFMTDAQETNLDNQSGTNTGDNSPNSDSNAYADSKVIDSIADADTTHAPSRNAVFDALALKLDANAPITGATKTKITYDADGLVTAGADATTADIADSANKRYVTDAQQTVITNTSGTNSGNETTGTIGTLINGAGAATPNDTDLVATAESSVLKKITWTNVKAFLKTYFDTLYQAAFANGYGLTGTTTKAVSLSSASAYVTAETAISAATYADITGASISLAAGTWLIVGQVNARAANAIIQVFVAITDGANAVVSEIAASRPASGTASLNSPISCNVCAIVSPGSTTTYKLRGARGLTTHTATWTAMDGNGVNTANHVSNNTDKGTGIFAIRIA